jgi:hypothetical protein
MPKLKELFKNIATRIGSNELSDIAENNGFDIDIDDNIMSSVNERMSKLMTIDAARNNPDLVAAVKEELKPQMKKSLLTNIDESINANVGKFLSEDQIAELTGIERTQDRLGKFFELAEHGIKNNSKDSKLKEINDQLKKQLSDLNANFKVELEKKDGELKKLDQGYKNKLINTKLDSVLGKYTLGEKYQEDFVKNALFSDIKGKVSKLAKLTLKDDGSIVPKNPENDELDLFVDNKKIENIKDIIDPLMKSYTKKTPGTSKGNPSEYKPASQTAEKSKLAQDLIKRREANEFI